MPGGPYMSTYYATKAYVVSLTNAIHQEVKEFGSNVSVSALCPGPVDTNFNKRANVEFSLKGITSQYCVSYALYHMFRKRLIIIPKLEIRLATLGMRFLPRKLGLVLLSRQQHKKTS
jgi:short-subunit dehydrogenase